MPWRYLVGLQTDRTEYFVLTRSWLVLHSSLVPGIVCHVALHIINFLAVDTYEIASLSFDHRESETIHGSSGRLCSICTRILKEARGDMAHPFFFTSALHLMPDQDAKFIWKGLEFSTSIKFHSCANFDVFLRFGNPIQSHHVVCFLARLSRTFPRSLFQPSAPAPRCCCSQSLAYMKSCWCQTAVCMNFELFVGSLERAAQSFSLVFVSTEDRFRPQIQLP